VPPSNPIFASLPCFIAHCNARLENPMRPILIALGATVLTSTPAPAADLHVPRNFPTIQSAIDAANPGDTVLVAPGVYNESILIQNKPLSLIGVKGPQTTIVDAAGLDTYVVGIVGVPGKKTILDGFTIRNGKGAGNQQSRSGGGIIIDSGEAEIANCIVTQNSVSANSSAQGGGSYQGLYTTVSWVNCQFINNSVSAKNSALGGGAFQNQDTTVNFANCQFIDNYCEVEFGAGGWGARGGAVYAAEWGTGLTTLDGCIIDGNKVLYGQTAFARGGGLYLLNASMANCAVTDNFSEVSHPPTMYGGGIEVKGVITMTDCEVIGNQPGGLAITSSYAASQSLLRDCTFTQNASAERGGAVYVDAGTLFVEGCTFQQNSALLDGGAINAYKHCTVAISDCTFEENTAGNGGGAVVVITFEQERPTLHAVQRCLFHANSAKIAGALAVQATGCIVTACEFVGNAATYGGALGIYPESPGVFAESCTFIRNTAEAFGGAAFVGVYGNQAVPVYFESCVMQGNFADVLGGAILTMNSQCTLTNVTACGNAPIDVEGMWIDGGGNDICPPTTPSAADFNLDYRVDGADLGSLLAVWGTDSEAADLDKSGDVSQGDLAILFAVWTG
jgi:predicted outer membrane repeat protein